MSCRRSHTLNFSDHTYLLLFPLNMVPKIKVLMKKYANFMSLTDIKLSSLNTVPTYIPTSSVQPSSSRKSCVFLLICNSSFHMNDVNHLFFIVNSRAQFTVDHFILFMVFRDKYKNFVSSLLLPLMITSENCPAPRDNLNIYTCLPSIS